MHRSISHNLHRHCYIQGTWHCATLIITQEGVSAFMKGRQEDTVVALSHDTTGVVGSFLRLGPHFSLTFVFLEQMRRMLDKLSGGVADHVCAPHERAPP